MKCTYCGEKLLISEMLDGHHMECGLRRKAMPPSKSNSTPSWDSTVSSSSNASVSTHSVIADSTISLVKFLFFVCFILTAISSFVLFEGGFAFGFFVISTIVLIISFGTFSIFAEIYTNLKEINAKIKAPDNN